MNEDVRIIGERELVVYTTGTIFLFIGERERANLVVRLAMDFLYNYVCRRRYTYRKCFYVNHKP